MKVLCVIALLLLVVAPAFAQTETNELLASPHVHDFITLQVTSGQLEYQADGDLPQKFSPIQGGKASFVIDKTTGIFLRGFNPFLHSVSATQTTFSDTSFGAVQKFVDAAAGLSKSIGSGTKSASSATLDSALNTANANLAASVEKQKNLDEKMSNLQSSIAAEKKQKKPNAKKINELTTKYNLYKEQKEAANISADYLSRTVAALSSCKQTPKSYFLAAWIESATANNTSCPSNAVLESFCNIDDLIYSVDDTLNLSDWLSAWSDRATGFDEIYGKPDGIVPEIEKIIKDLNSKIDDEEFQLRRLPDATEAATKSWSPDCRAYRQLTQSTAAQLSQQGNQLLVEKKKVAESLQGILSMLSAYNDPTLWTASGPHSSLFRIATVDASFDNGTTLLIKVNHRTFDASKDPIVISETKGSESTLRLRHFAPFVPEVAAGMAASELRIPKYGTAQVDGRTVVATAGSDFVRVIPSLFFNGIIRFHAENFAYPMFQIGIGTGADRPSVLAGLGIRFTHPQHLSISAGWAVTWFKDLDKLKLGNEVKGTADIDADLKLRRSSAEPYLSIQLSF